MASSRPARFRNAPRVFDPISTIFSIHLEIPGKEEGQRRCLLGEILARGSDFQGLLIVGGSVRRRIGTAMDLGEGEQKWTNELDAQETSSLLVFYISSIVFE